MLSLVLTYQALFKISLDNYSIKINKEIRLKPKELIMHNNRYVFECCISLATKLNTTINAIIAITNAARSQSYLLRSKRTIGLITTESGTCL